MSTIGNMTGAVANPIGALTSQSNTIANSIGQFYSASLLPSIQGGSATGDINFSANTNCFDYYKMRCKKEYLEIIDDYFSKFGYAINRITDVNFTGRANWNYVEIGSHESIGYGEVPSNALETINNACKKGVTIWHNHANVGNYALENNII